MSKVPTTQEVKHHYLCCWQEQYREPYADGFDTWLSGVISDAKAEGLREGQIDLLKQKAAAFRESWLRWGDVNDLALADGCEKQIVVLERRSAGVSDG